MKRIALLASLLLLSQAGIIQAQNSLLNQLIKTTNAPSTNAAVASLGTDQVAQALKEALGKGVQEAVSQLGKDNAFLTNAAVKIPMPQSLQRVEKTLHNLRQDALANQFVATLNHAAEQAVPQAAAVFGDSLKQMTVADAKNILTGPTDAATQYFRKTSSDSLRAKFLPIVKQHTETAGVTASYKKMMDVAGGSATLNQFGSTLGAFGVKTLTAADLDAYVTDRAIDGLFKMVAEQEKRIREMPAARTTELLQQVFGSLTTPK